MTPTERAIHANHPSARNISVPASAEAAAQEPGVTEPSPPVTLGELSDTLEPLDGLVTRLRLLKGGRQ